jgi:cytochrome c biogenesis protein CcmG/thiol:disulfide interchange protein DsbE
VVFWAAWCEPCRQEAPSLLRFVKSPPAGIRVVVVSQDESLDAVTKFLGQEAPAEWHLRLDADRRLFQAFRAEKLPASFLEVQGQLVARFGGARDWTARSMRGLLERLVSQAMGAAP